MSQIERYRELYEYETDCNSKMLTMIESVPDASRADARFQRAVTLAGHLAACRENWLDFMTSAGPAKAAWFDPECDLATLRDRFAAIESRWTDYLAGLDDAALPQNFEFVDGGETWALPRQVQIEQLVGHACYHRGQVALLVDQLGGETVDTDYVDWAFAKLSG
ncbi:MAG TPA: DinB family protein [Capsulimonadaceae bacterium]|jgi:uncharacterized damage-inducible protein DinB